MKKYKRRKENVFKNWKHKQRIIKQNDYFIFLSFFSLATNLQRRKYNCKRWLWWRSVERVLFIISIFSFFFRLTKYSSFPFRFRWLIDFRTYIGMNNWKGTHGTNRNSKFLKEKKFNFFQWEWDSRWIWFSEILNVVFSTLFNYRCSWIQFSRLIQIYGMSWGWKNDAFRCVCVCNWKQRRKDVNWIQRNESSILSFCFVTFSALLIFKFIT